MIAWGNANKYALLFVIFYSSQHNIFVATTINQKSAHFNKCLPFSKSQTTDVQPLSSSMFKVSLLCGLISYAGSSGSGQRGPHCRVAQQSPQGQALCSRSPEAIPLPCIPASVHMSIYGCHMWSCRKADAVFPFVKSSFWKAVSILMAKVESLSVKGERAVKRQQAQFYCAEW